MSMPVECDEHGVMGKGKQSSDMDPEQPVTVRST